MKDLKTEEFIKKAIEKHGKKYDYSKVEYGRNNSEKVEIVCPIHGSFFQTPSNHLNNHGCPKCALFKIQEKYAKEFEAKARKIHGDKYDYSKVRYIDSNTPVCIVCPNHGEFMQKPKYHLRGKGCKKCHFDKLRMTKESFLKDSINTHGSKYDYSKVDFVNADTPVCIICPVHGEFNQTPRKHANGRGCVKCSHDTMRLTKESFIEKAMKIHGDKYDYSKVEYLNSYTEICIICPKHGEFTQTPNRHLLGYGCSKCSQDKNRLTNEDFIERLKKNSWR